MSRTRSHRNGTPVIFLTTSFLGALVLAVLARPAAAAQPTFSGMQPWGVQRGTEVQVQFTGGRLGDVQELMFYSPGITVKSLDEVKDNAVKATLSVAADCRLGIHAVRLRAATGLSDLRTFTVGALPEVAEVEPNSEFETPQAVTRNCTVSGIVQNEDVDYFVIEAKKGERISAELEGIRLGYTFFDPYLAILNEARFELARSDDAALLRQDCLCAVVAPEDGKYIVQIRESAYGGNGNCKYRLHVGQFPRPRAVLPAGGKPGETLQVKWIGDPAGDWTQTVTLPGEVNPGYELFAQDDHGIAPSPNVVRVVDLQNTLEAEPNDEFAQATAGPGPGAFNGVIEKPGDTDCFKFTAKAGQQYDIRVYARNLLRSPLDSVLVVRRATGNAAVGNNDDTGGPDSYLRFKAPADDDYIVVINDHLGAGGPAYAYRVEITPIVPTLTMQLPERVRYIATTLNVPRGNRMALMVNAARANFGGELNVAVEGMPAGLSLETVTMAANRGDVPVLFTAAADAAPAGALADLVGRPVDENLKVVGHLRQRTMLVRGQNNRDVWGHDAQRMAVAVTDEVPFKIEIVQPQVPIVRFGSMGLKVVATRAEGYTKPIAVRMLYNPPGIGSSGSISIPEGKNEAVIPLTANSGASIGSWPIIVTSRAAVGNGSVEVATQMAHLEIADSFFNFAFDKAAAELGQQTELVVKVEKKADFPGEAKVQLLGLPANTSTPPEGVSITKDSTEMVFPITVDEKARPGNYKSLVCRAVITQNGEPITHTMGTGELRVDKPLPPKVAAPKPAAKPTPQPVAAKPAEPVKKRLTRLEQLRLERKKALEAAGEQ